MSHRNVWRIEATEPQRRTNVVLTVLGGTEAGALKRFWRDARKAVTPWGAPVEGEWPVVVTRLESEPVQAFVHDPKGEGPKG